MYQPHWGVTKCAEPSRNATLSVCNNRPAVLTCTRSLSSKERVHLPEWAMPPQSPQRRREQHGSLLGRAAVYLAIATESGDEPLAQVVKDATNARAAAKVIVSAQPYLKRDVHLVVEDAVQVRS